MAAAARVVFTWGASLSVVGAAAQLLWRRWKRFRSRRKFDGLDGVVSFSSRLIAAARAIESMRPDALFVDPFAQLLAGPKAMARHQKFDEADKSVDIKTGKVVPAPNQPPPPQPQPTTADSNAHQGQHPQPQAAGDAQPQPLTQQQQQEVQSSSQPGRQVNRLVLRTVFFDEATLLVTGQPATRSDRALAPVAAHLQQHGLKKCRQVVMLGAGMDTRPWRLPLDHHLKWYELDRQDVLAAKQTALQDAGASFEPLNPPAAAATGAIATSTDQQAVNGPSSSSGRGSVEHPLRVGKWACASADLQQPGWVAKLQEAGLTPDEPIVWAAEGLLYYLEPDSVAPMLKEAAKMSSPGSMLITNFMTDEGLKLLHVSPLTAKPGDRSGDAAAASAASNPSSQSAENGTTAAATEPATAAAGSSGQDGGDAGSGQQGSAEGGVSTPAGGRKPGGVDDGIQKIGLLSHFKWGCPDNVEEFFAECGWKLLVRYSLTQGAEAFGWSMQHTPASRVRTHSQEVQFVVGVVMK